MASGLPRAMDLVERHDEVLLSPEEASRLATASRAQLLRQYCAHPIVSLVAKTHRMSLSPVRAHTPDADTPLCHSERSKCFREVTPGS